MKIGVDSRAAGVDAFIPIRRRDVAGTLAGRVGKAHGKLSSC